MSAPVAIALVGLRCVGKTSVGRELARLLEVGFVDLDDALAAAAGEGCCAAHVPRVGDVLATLGVEAFRDLEERELARALAHERPFVLATGGGAVERAANRELLATRARCVWLREDPALLAQRLSESRDTRPALGPADAAAELAELAARREPWYRAVAELVLDGRGESAAQVALRVRAALALGR